MLWHGIFKTSVSEELKYLFVIGYKNSNFDVLKTLSKHV
jgi:hypothetical protein